MNKKKSIIIMVIFVMCSFTIAIPASEKEKTYNYWLNKNAITYCEEATKINPRCASVWSNTGEAMFILKDYEKALECYENATKLDPLLAETWLKKGNTFYEIGKYEDALACYDNVIALDSSFFEEATIGKSKIWISIETVHISNLLIDLVKGYIKLLQKLL